VKEKKQGKFRSDRQPQSDGEMDGLEMTSKLVVLRFELWLNGDWYIRELH
jgi:hypothetical protein